MVQGVYQGYGVAYDEVEGLYEGAWEDGVKTGKGKQVYFGVVVGSILIEDSHAIHYSAIYLLNFGFGNGYIGLLIKTRIGHSEKLNG